MKGDIILFLSSLAGLYACGLYGTSEAGMRERTVQLFIALPRYVCPAALIGVSSFLENEYLKLTLFLLPALVYFIIKLNGKSFHEIPGFDSLLYFSSAVFIVSLLFGNISGAGLFVPAAAVIVPGIVSAFVSGKIKSRAFKLTSETKSLSGSISYFVAGTAVLAAGMFLIPDIYPAGIAPASAEIYIIYSSAVIAFVGALAEAMSSRGLNYFYGVIIYAVLIQVFAGSGSFGLLNGFCEGMFFAFIIAAASYRLRFLTLNGSVATFLLAGFLFGFGGIKWSVPILAFFILSSLLSKARKKVNEEVEIYFEKSGVRDYMQVLANGGLGGILVVLDLLYHNEIYYLLYISVLAAVCADTWATEIGTMKRTPTYNILNFKRVEQGISVPGISASVIASAVIALSGIFWIAGNSLIYIFFSLCSRVRRAVYSTVISVPPSRCSTNAAYAKRLPNVKCTAVLKQVISKVYTGSTTTWSILLRVSQEQLQLFS